MKILLAGESWNTLSIHQKGLDTFQTCTYQEGGKWLIQAFESVGAEVTYMPSHVASNDFPYTLRELQNFDAVVLSDIGTNTLLLTDDTFMRSQKKPNRLELIKEYVINGGGFAMMGGYMSFQGIDGKARYAQSAIADILPVKMMDTDDRMEAPQGVSITINNPNHPIMQGVPTVWPEFLGYNMLFEKQGCDTIATCGTHSFIASAEYHNGRTFAFASDIAPHWGTPKFVEWEYYNVFFGNVARWLTKK